MAVSVTLHRTISICSIYIPPRSKIVEKDLDEIVNQLPTPFLLLGDFNGHNFIWGSDDVNDKGRIIENFINKNNLCLYNNKTPTYLHPATGTYTSLDLSICYPTLLLDYEWKVHDDLCGSDHFRYSLITSHHSWKNRLPGGNLLKLIGHHSKLFVKQR